MAKYTIELREIVDHGINIFDFPYVFYDETKKEEFERKFIQHFYFREIGCETVDRFKFYLQDKMQVVFPYYNKLFEATQIEYEVLDNYKLTETYTRNVENVNKQHGISSTVGQALSNVDSETKQNKTVDTVTDFDSNEANTENDTITTKTDTTNKSNTENNETIKSEISKTATNTATAESNNVKKFLDTPQGLTDLTNSKYLTNLTQDTTKNSQSNGSTETATDKKTAKTTNENETTESTESENTRKLTKSATVEQDTSGKETTADNVTGNSHSEQKSTTDNNTRTYSNSEQKESYTIYRKGNIGVDTDSDGIEKHLRLQKTLTKIEQMFFEECEDLFMLVY